MKKVFGLVLGLTLLFATFAGAADQRIQYNERMVGANHPTRTDTLNRLTLVEHNNDGTHDLLTQVTDPWVDVRAFGAVGDGTTNDTVAIQAAIDSIEAAGTGILLLSNMYLTDALDVTMPASRQGIIITGLGKNTGLKANGDIDILTIDMGASNRQGFVLRDMEFDMNSKDAKAVVITRAGQLSIFDNVFTDGISGTSTKTLFELGSTAHVTRFQNFTITGHTNKTVKGISLSSNVVVFDMVNLQYLDVALYQNTGTSINTLTVKNSRIDNNNRAIEVDTAAGIKYVFRDNHFESNSDYSIYLKGSNASTDRLVNVTIKDNYFTGLNAATTYGIYAQRIKGLKIIDNDFKGSQATPLGKSIDWTTTATEVELRGNSVGPLSDPISVQMNNFVNALHIDDVTVDQLGGGSHTQNTVGGRLAPISRTKQFTDLDATPDVSVSNNWYTNTSAVTITGFDGGYEGQTIIVKSRGAITYDVTGSNLKGGTIDLVTANGDITIWWRDDSASSWLLKSFTDMSGDYDQNGALIIDITDTEALLVRKNGDGGDVFVVDTTNGVVALGGVTPVTGTYLTLPQENNALTPALAFGDGDTGFYEVVDDQIAVSLNGARQFTFSGASLIAITAGAGIVNVPASTTLPTLDPNRVDTNTGVGWAGADALSLIAGGVEGIRVTETAGVIATEATGSLGIGIAPVTGTRLTLPQENDFVTPTIAFGDGDTGLYESADDTISIAIAGAKAFQLSSTGFNAVSGGGAIVGGPASATTPTVRPNVGDGNTGLGSAAVDQLSLIAGGVEGIRVTETAGVIATEMTDSVGINGTPGYALDVWGGGTKGIVVFGGDNNAITRTNAGNKNNIVGSAHYTNTEQPLGLLFGQTFATTSVLSIGGGSSLLNAATRINFFTAANNTTTVGTEVVRLDNSTTAGNTRMLIWDVDNNTLERVTVGIADSGGAGFKLLRIPN